MLYRVKSGSYGRTEKDGTPRVYKAGEVVDIDDPRVVASLGSQLVRVYAEQLAEEKAEAARAAQAQADQATGAGNAPGGAHPIHDLNASEATELVGKAETREALQALLDAEMANPKHTGGRVSVVRAIAQRMNDLA